MLAIWSEGLTVHDNEVDAITALRSGDIAGLSTLVRLYQLSALHVAFNLCGNQQVAEDAVAEAFLAVQRHIGTYDRSRPFEPWFYRIVINTVHAGARRDRRLRTVSDSDAHLLLQQSPDPGPGPEIRAIHSESERMLWQEIDRLPRKQREAIILRYYLDMDERTMAGVLSVPIGTVKWRLFQARKKLHREMCEAEEGHAPLTKEGQRP